MLLFLSAIILLVLGYFVYGAFVERVFKIDEKKSTPAIKYNDGVDFVPMPLWRIFLIQFLNIAGLGPIFGAIMGAVYGPCVILWIVFGSIFAGGVHDYLSGMLSVRFEGRAFTFVGEKILGKHAKEFILFALIALLILLGTVFAVNPAKMLSSIFNLPFAICIFAVFFYYFLSTFLPIDKIIGKFYPALAVFLVVMTAWLLFAIVKDGMLSNLQFNFSNQHPDNLPIFPLMFVTVACGAISGFHATQSPIMARCLTNEKQGRKIFYGAMILEGIVALIWATLGIVFYNKTGGLLQAINAVNSGGVISEIAHGLLGGIGAKLTILVVIIFSITSGDTAFRSARLFIADAFRINQKNVISRLILSAIILSTGILLSFSDTTVLWRYFAFVNQLLATFALFVASFYLKHEGRNYLISLVPALFMSVVTSSYILSAKIGFNLPNKISIALGIFVAIVLFMIFKRVHYKKHAIAKAKAADF